MLWLTVWFMVILKIPVLYLAYVIWWAVKDPPGADFEPDVEGIDGGDGPGWRRGPPRRIRGRRGGPHGSRSRGPTRAPARVHARAAS